MRGKSISSGLRLPNPRWYIVVMILKNCRNAVFPSFYDHIKITANLQSGQPGELSADQLNRSPVTEVIKKPRGDWQEWWRCGLGGPTPTCGG